MTEQLVYQLEHNVKVHIVNYLLWKLKSCDYFLRPNLILHWSWQTGRKAEDPGKEDFCSSNKRIFRRRLHRHAETLWRSGFPLSYGELSWYPQLIWDLLDEFIVSKYFLLIEKIVHLDSQVIRIFESIYPRVNELWKPCVLSVIVIISIFIKLTVHNRTRLSYKI